MAKRSTLIIALVGIFIFGSYQMSITQSAGAPIGYAGSPGDGAANCLSCHSGPGWTSQDITLTIDGQDSIAYIAGQTYDIVVTIDGSGSTFNSGGFTITAEKFGTQNKVGTWIGSNSVQVQSNSHVTHTNSSNTPSGGTLSWSFQWTAPAAGTGDIRFFVNGIVGDGNGANTGDIMVSVVTLIPEDANSGVGEWNSMGNELYPNPAKDHINLGGLEGNIHYRITDLGGRVVMEGEERSWEDRCRIELDGLKTGLYFLQAESEEGQLISRRFLVND